MRQSTAKPPPAGASLHAQAKWFCTFLYWMRCWWLLLKLLWEISKWQIPYKGCLSWYPMIEIPCLFFISIEDIKLSCESDYSIHTELSLLVCTYCSATISFVFSVVCITCLMLHIQSGCILMEEGALPIKVSVITCRWIFVSLCFHCGFNFWIHLDQFLLRIKSRTVLFFTSYCGLFTVPDLSSLPKHLEKELLMTQLKCTVKKFTY